jgi:hypothetical protein
MKQELIDRLKYQFPHVFSNEEVSIDISNGWYELLYGLSQLIETEITYSVPEEVRDDIYAIQIKEKFGILRVYLNHETPYISGVIAMAEYMSQSICEHCSLPGKLRQGGWLRTLCDACDEATTRK